MSPYLFTLAFLMMMSLITSSEVVRFSQESLETNCYSASREYLVATEELHALSHVEELRKEENQGPKKHRSTTISSSTKYVKKGKALGVNAARPPNNSRLNLYTLVHKEAKKGVPKGFSLYEVFAELLRSLYQLELFQTQAGLEYRLLDRLIDKKEWCKDFSTPDELARLDLEDAELQKIFFLMLNGTASTPSLLNYITFDRIDQGTQSRKINLYFADPALVAAIFPEGEIAEKILKKRDELWEEIAFQEEHRLEIPQDECVKRGEFKAALKREIEEILKSEGLAAKKYSEHVFDYTLSQPGSVIFLEDPLTGRLIREKYTPKIK